MNKSKDSGLIYLKFSVCHLETAGYLEFDFGSFARVQQSGGYGPSMLKSYVINKGRMSGRLFLFYRK